MNALIIDNRPDGTFIISSEGKLSYTFKTSANKLGITSNVAELLKRISVNFPIIPLDVIYNAIILSPIQHEDKVVMLNDLEKILSKVVEGEDYAYIQSSSGVVSLIPKVRKEILTLFDREIFTNQLGVDIAIEIVKDLARESLHELDEAKEVLRVLLETLINVWDSRKTSSIPLTQLLNKFPKKWRGKVLQVLKTLDHCGITLDNKRLEVKVNSKGILLSVGKLLGVFYVTE